MIIDKVTSKLDIVACWVKKQMSDNLSLQMIIDIPEHHANSMQVTPISVMQEDFPTGWLFHYKPLLLRIEQILSVVNNFSSRR